MNSVVSEVAKRGNSMLARSCEGMGLGLGLGLGVGEGLFPVDVQQDVTV